MGQSTKTNSFNRFSASLELFKNLNFCAKIWIIFLIFGAKIFKYLNFRANYEIISTDFWRENSSELFKYLNFRAKNQQNNPIGAKIQIFEKFEWIRISNFAPKL